MTRHFFEITDNGGHRIADIVAMDIVRDGYTFTDDGKTFERWWIQFPNLPQIEIVLPEGMILRKVA